MLDLVIIGGSAAGCSAAIFAARRKLNFKMISENIGGEVALAPKIENWLGIESIAGFELAQKFANHVRSYGVEIEEGWRVEKLAAEKNYFTLIAKDGRGHERNYQSKAVILATGIHPRALGVPGEEALARKGLSYCSVCDGPLFKNKITATIGSGSSALASVLMMSKIAKKIYLISKFQKTDGGGFPKGETVLVDQVKTLPNVEIIYGAKIDSILGKDRVSGLTYLDEQGEKQTLTLDAVLVHIGMTPNSQLADFINKDPLGQIIINEKCQTSAPGLFAAGDVTNIPYKYIGISAGQGIVAAMSAIDYVNRWK